MLFPITRAREGIYKDPRRGVQVPAASPIWRGLGEALRPGQALFGPQKGSKRGPFCSRMGPLWSIYGHYWPKWPKGDHFGIPPIPRPGIPRSQIHRSSGSQIQYLRSTEQQSPTKHLAQLATPPNAGRRPLKPAGLPRSTRLPARRVPQQRNSTPALRIAYPEGKEGPALQRDRLARDLRFGGLVASEGLPRPEVSDLSRG